MEQNTVAFMSEAFGNLPLESPHVNYSHGIFNELLYSSLLVIYFFTHFRLVKSACPSPHKRFWHDFSKFEKLWNSWKVFQAQVQCPC